MKIDTTDPSMFTTSVPEKDAVAWLVGDLEDLVSMNRAIDEAVSYASAHGTAFVLIEITKRQ